MQQHQPRGVATDATEQLLPFIGIVNKVPVLHTDKAYSTWPK